MVTGSVDNRTGGGAINSPADALGEGRKETGGVKPDVEASNIACARSIKGSDFPDISSLSSDGSDRVGRFSEGMDSSGISYPPRSVETIWG